MHLLTLNDISDIHQHIFISAHYDDAVYSCGGTIAKLAQQNIKPLIITVFGGAPEPSTPLGYIARLIHQGTGFSETTSAQEVIAVRQIEDTQACEQVGSDFLWLDYHDKIYRPTPYFQDENQVLWIHPEDRWIEHQLAQELFEVHQRFPNIHWYFPLAIGHHVDHLTVYEAGYLLAQKGVKVRYYEDFPYAAQDKNLETRFSELDYSLTSLCIDISDTLKTRIDASCKYKTQNAMNFGSHEELPRKMDAYPKSIKPEQGKPYERYWLPQTQ